MVQLFKLECMFCLKEVPNTIFFRDDETFEQILNFVNSYGACIWCATRFGELYRKTFIKIRPIKLPILEMVNWLESGH